MISKKYPVHILRCGNIKAAIWKNEWAKGEYFLASFSRPFKNRFGKWCNGSTYSLADLEALTVVVQQAKEWIATHNHELERKDDENHIDSKTEASC